MQSVKWINITEVTDVQVRAGSNIQDLNMTNPLKNSEAKIILCDHGAEDRTYYLHFCEVCSEMTLHPHSSEPNIVINNNSKEAVIVDCC